MERQWVGFYRRLIREIGLEGSCIDKDPVRSVDITSDDAIKKGVKEPKFIVDAVKRKAEELADDGAEAIQIGCGFFSPICTMEGLTSVRDGKVPLLDPLLIGLKVAEIMVTFKRTLGLPIRHGLSCYDQIPADILNHIRKSYNLPPIGQD